MGLLTSNWCAQCDERWGGESHYICPECRGAGENIPIGIGNYGTVALITDVPADPKWSQVATLLNERGNPAIDEITFFCRERGPFTAQGVEVGIGGKRWLFGKAVTLMKNDSVTVAFDGG